jgi:hypothetical protein
MCHYVQLTFPEPAVIVVTLSLVTFGKVKLGETVVVVPVRPAPSVIVNVAG